MPEWRYARFEPHEHSVERLAISLRSVSAVTVAHDSISDDPLSPEELRTRVKEAGPSMGGGVKSQGGRRSRDVSELSSRHTSVRASARASPLRAHSNGLCVILDGTVHVLDGGR